MSADLLSGEKKNDLCYEGRSKWKKKLIKRKKDDFRFIEISKGASMNIEEFLTLAAKEEASDSVYCRASIDDESNVE